MAVDVSRSSSLSSFRSILIVTQWSSTRQEATSSESSYHAEVSMCGTEAPTLYQNREHMRSKNLIKECVKYGWWQYLSRREIFTGLKSYIPDLILYNHLHECLHLHFEAKTIRFTWCNIYQCINEQRNKLFQEHISVKSF